MEEESINGDLQKLANMVASNDMEEALNHSSSIIENFVNGKLTLSSSSSMIHLCSSPI